MCEELGDILLQVALHSVIAEEETKFNINDVITQEAEKMIRRHPHVFGNVTVEDSQRLSTIGKILKSLKRRQIILLMNCNGSQSSSSNHSSRKSTKESSKSGDGFYGYEQVLEKV